MKRYTLHILISAIALLVAIGHVTWPGLRIDAITLTLIAIAVLPWLGSVFKSVELPGGLKVEYRDLEKAAEDAAKAGLLSPPDKKSVQIPLSAIAEHDPNLALAGLRIEIERRLRTIADTQGINSDRMGIGQLLQMLREKGLISPQENTVLSKLIQLLNRAVHGAEVDSRAAQWAIEVGPQILSALDKLG